MARAQQRERAREILAQRRRRRQRNGRRSTGCRSNGCRSTGSNGRRAEPAGLRQFVDDRRDPLDDRREVGLGMRGRQEAGAPLPHIQPLVDEAVEERIEIAAHLEPEQRTEMRDPHRRAAAREHRVERVREPCRACIERLLQRRAGRLEAGQHRARGRHRQMVLVEGAREEHRLGMRAARVAVVPCAAVDSVEEARTAADHADRQAAANDLAVRDEIRAHVEPGLRAARMDAEAGQHLVEHERRAVRARDLAQPLQERARLQLGPPALHRLDEDRREFAGAGLELRQCVRLAVVEHQHVGDRAGRDARAAGPARRGDQQPVRVAVVRAREQRDLGAAGGRAREAHGRHHRLGAGVAERDPLDARQVADQFGHLARERRLRADLQAPLPLLGQRRADEVGLMAEQGHAEAHREIQIRVAVHVVETGARAVTADDRVQHLLDRGPETGARAAVGERRPACRRARARAARARHVARRQLIEVAALRGAQRRRDGRGRRRDRGGRGKRERRRLSHGRNGRRLRARPQQRKLLREQALLLPDQIDERGLIRGRRGRVGCRPLPCGDFRGVVGLVTGRRERGEMRGQRARRRDVGEQLSRTDLDAEPLFDPMHGIDQHQRIRAQFEKRGVRVERIGVAVQQPAELRDQDREDPRVARHGRRRVMHRRIGARRRRGDRHGAGRAGADPGQAMLVGARGLSRRDRYAIHLRRAFRDGRLVRRDHRRRAGRRRRIRVPVTLALERVARQRHRMRALPAVHAAPVHVLAVRVQGAERIEQRAALVPVRRQRRDEVRRLAIPAARAEARQRRARAQLHDQLRPARRDAAQAVDEAHRFEQVAAPVIGIGRRPRRPDGSRQSSHERNRRRPPVDARRLRAKRLDHRLHQRRMECMGGIEPAALDALRRARLQQRVERRRITGDDRRLRSVERGERDAPRLARQQVRHGLGRREQHRHAPRLGQRRRQAAARRDQRERRLQVDRARHAGRDVFAEAVPQHRARTNAPRAPQFSERIAQHEYGRLHLLGIVGARRRPFAAQQPPDLARRTQCVQRVIATLDRTPERRLLAIQAPARANLPRALPGHHEHEFRARVARGRALHAAPVRAAVEPARQARRELRGRVRRHREPVRKMRAPERSRAAQRGQRRRFAIRLTRAIRTQLAHVGIGERAQRGQAARRQRQQTGARLIRRLRVRRLDRRFLDDQMTIGAAETEAADPGHARRIAGGPGRQRARDLERRAVERQIRIERVQMQMRRNLPMPQHQHGLDQARAAGRRLQVPDVGLHRTDPAPRIRRAPFAEHRLQRAHLDRIAHLRAGAVRLDIADARGRDARVRARAADHRLLRLAVRRGDAVAGAVLVHGGTADHREDPIAGRERVVEPLQDHHAAALAAHIAVGVRVERAAAARRRHHARLRERDRHVRREHEIHAARDRERGLALAQAAARDMQRDQRRRTRALHAEARPVQVEEIGQPVRGETGRAARAVVAIDAVRIAAQHAHVVGVADPDEHARVAAAQAVRRDAGILQRGPRGLHHEPLLRIHALGFAPRNAEELRVELVDVVDEAAPARDHLARGVLARIVEVREAPALGRHLAHRVDAVAQQRPERLDVERAGKPATHPDDRDRYAARARRGGPRRRRRRLHARHAVSSGWDAGARCPASAATVG